MITFSIECKDAAHVRRVELALQCAELIAKIDRALADDTTNARVSPARIRAGIREVIKIELRADPTELGLKPLAEEVAP